MALVTVYIGAIRNDPVAVAAAVGLPARTTVLFGLLVGWEDPDRPSAIKPRLPQQVVLHDGRYDPADEAGAIDAYDATSRAFQQAQGLPESGWSAPALARSADAQALHGRAALRETYARQGFPLR